MRQCFLALISFLMFQLPDGAVAQAQAPSAAASPMSTVDSDPHLVGWWQFDEPAGKQAKDSSPQAHHGTIAGGWASAPGKIRGAILLDGREHLEVTGYKGITGTQPRTVAAWIKTKSTSGRIVSWGHNDAGQLWDFGFIRGRIGVTPKGGYLYMNPATHDDVWHHVAVVVREAAPPNLHDDAQLYLDGRPAEIHDIGLLDLWPIDTGSDMDVRIGPGFKGLIDDLRIYDRPLSADEINALFLLPAP